MNILNECSFLKEHMIKKIEEAYKCKYVLESCIRDRSNQWANVPCAIFYNEEAHPSGSNYMAMFLNSDGKHLSVTDGISATEPFNGLMTEDGTVIYSHYRHDFRQHGDVFVDGGRDYFKSGGSGIEKAKIVKLKVIKDEVTIVVDNKSKV